MNFLFVHQYFPGQYLHLARHLQQAGHNVVFLTQRRGRELPGIRILEYLPLPASGAIPPHLQEVEMGVMNGLAVARICEGLKREGFTPDIMIGHCGWGEVLFVKDVWPNVPLLGYFEFFYRVSGSDLDFDPEFPSTTLAATPMLMRNPSSLLSLDAANWGQTPTEWQRAQYPEIHRSRISVIHEGIDTDLVHPEPSARLWLRGGASFAPGDEIITYSARNLEPYRGFHTLYAGAGEGAGAAAKRARDHRRRRRRQLWPLARAGGELARIHAHRAGGPPRFAPRLLCRLAAVSTISGGVAALHRACLSDLPLCAVV